MIKVISNDSSFANALEAGARAAQQRKVVTQELHRMRTQSALLRVAVNNTMTPDDYAAEIIRARYNYGTNKPIRGAAALILGAYGWLVLKVGEFFDMNNARWRGTV